MDNLAIVKMAFCAWALVFGAPAHSASSAVGSVVDPATQTLRDASRWQVLVMELTTEQTLLSAARTALASAAPEQRAALQPDLDLRTGNVQALNDEMTAIRSAARSTGQARTVRLAANITPIPTSPPNTDAAPVPLWDVYRRAPSHDISEQGGGTSAVHD